MFIFFIDGASFIALDNNWCYFLVYCDNKVINLNNIAVDWLFHSLRVKASPEPG